MGQNRKRKRPGDDADDSVEVKREALQALELAPPELALLSLEQAESEQIVVAACQELRHRALNIPVKAIAADLGDEHLRILEAVGHARVNGVTVTTLTKLLARGVTVKRLHNCLDTLISYGLVVKRMMIVTRPVMRRLNIIHLPRFAAEFKPEMFDDSADFESDEQSRKILCAAAETYLKALPTHSSVLSDLGRDLNLQKRHLEVLRTHIMQECKVDESFSLELFQAVLQPSQRASLEPKILNCVRYKPPNARKNSTYRRGIVLELGLLRQIYGIIEDSADKGATIIDLRNQIVLPGSKLPYKLVSVLAGIYSLKAESIILGKNKAFRLYLDSMAPSCNSNKDSVPAPVVENSLWTLSTSSTENCSAEEEPAPEVKVEKHYTVRANKALKVALGGTEVDGTSARRRDHILERLEEEKIISLSSLRASVFSMEKQRAETSSSTGDQVAAQNNANSLMSPAAVGKVDTRSIFRIATELELAKKLRLLQLPLPARNVSTKFRALRCVVAPGYEHNDVFIQGFVKNYCRDERLRRIYRNADQGQVVRFHNHGNDETILGGGVRLNGSARKRRRPDSRKTDTNAEDSKESISDSDGMSEVREGGFQTIRHASDIEADVSDLASPPRNEISYKIRRFVSQQKSVIHNHQFRKLGFAYGVMYRCKALHRFLWNALHNHGADLQLPGDDNDASLQDLSDATGDTGDGLSSTTDQPSAVDDRKQQASPSTGIVFSRESVLHSMPVHLYIQIFSGGGILSDAEFAIVEEAIAHHRNFDALPEALREKIWSHESQRTAKVLGTLADLGLVVPHKIGMKHLVKILRAGYTDGRDGVLSRALKDNALGGLFRFNKKVRIVLDDSGEKDRFYPPGDVQAGTHRRSVNEQDALRIVGFTEKTYSFANTLPLEFTFQSECEVDRYWEALECLCLEQMAMEVENPRRNEPAVCEVPKPVKTRARRMFRILAWIPKSRKPAPKHKLEESDDANTTHIRSSGIVSTNIRPRKKRRQNSNGHDGTKRSHKKKHPDTIDTEGQPKAGALIWTDEHEQLLVEYFIETCRSRWKITIPQGLQRDKEHVAFRNHTISRTGFGLVAIARKLGKRKIDVKKRLKEKLMEPVVKLLFENAKREAQLADNPDGLFHEEVAIQGSSRLTALFRRAVMMIVSPREEYHPLVAEELISFWSPHEIRLVWRYLWLKNWIVRASEKERGRGYCTSQRLQDSLKVTTLSYPLLLFQQAAEQESMVSSTLEEITADRPNSNESKQRGSSVSGPHNSDQLFEDDFPTNATPGQCALELACQVLGTCSLTAVHSTVFDTEVESEDALATQQTNGKRLPSSTKRESLLTCKSLKDRSGFAAHLANKVNVTKASGLIDSWRVETKMHAVTVEDADALSACEAFSQEKVDDNNVLGAVAFRPMRYRKDSEKALGQEVVGHIRESGEEGLTLPSLLEKLRSTGNDTFQGALPMRVIRCLNALVDQGVLICVNAYYDQRYIVKEHGDVWLLRPFSLVPSTGSSSTPQVVFEGEKDTLSFPWLKMDGGTNYKFLFAIQRKLLTLIIQAPGITEKRAHAKMNKLLSLQDTREAMSLLMEEGLVYSRAVTSANTQKKAPFALFGSSATQPSGSKVVKVADNVLATRCLNSSEIETSDTRCALESVENNAEYQVLVCVRRLSLRGGYCGHCASAAVASPIGVATASNAAYLITQIHKRELHANSLGSWWQLFSETYEELVQSVASPVRAEYSVRELGARQFALVTENGDSEAFVREDFHLQNPRGEALACSFWRRRAVRDADQIAELASSSSSSSLSGDEDKVSLACSVDEPLDSASTDNSSTSSWSSQQTAPLTDVDPCIIYLHGMSSSRKECIYLHRKVLADGFSLFAVDLSGSGLSGGDRVSFGYFEHEDLCTVVDYLYATGRASAVGVWGRDIGSAAALLHVKERMPYHYETMTVSRKEAKKLDVVEDKENHHILCIPPLTGLHFRFSKYSAAHGDFVLLAIDNVPVQGLSAAACYRLIQRSCKTNGGKARLQGFKRSSSSARDDKFIFALTADSAYGDMEQVLWDMLEMITKSAERRSLFFPSAMVTAVQKILANSIGKAGGFNFRDVRLLDAAPHFTLPCLFISASKKDFFMPSHAKVLCDRYGGSKSYIQFTGQIDDNRPAEVLDTAIAHFSKRFKLLKK
ncbi:unnamed protein product [Phytophthora lilii]|uniref:Unnamed protein product n=1 Tax=Phytophthora lilii TaxID=2077276 RepID=A0A9W6X1D8_9STRA|nr:unnamed protein product [Phytophthora lilii]